ncbi:MAG TPA: PstS family phosphate ABC transporter substrate-binding protein [Trueperaceae bacterium]|nr:PstS family phosphate ABC transporter substrate-binding protein [Trueperaceae bacterium]
MINERPFSRTVPAKSVLACLAALLITSAFAQSIRVDGSSTVYPISLAMAEEFSIENREAEVSVAFSGTGAGFSKLCAGEIEIADASRVVKQSELDACAANGIELIELPIAADALTVVVHPDNTWAQCLTIDELHAIWAPASTVTSWNQVRPEWPEAELVLYGPGTDSGTFDYFTEAVNGESGAIRTDFFPSEDDNVLVKGVQSDVNALGYFGFAYYAENQGRVKAVSIDGGNGCVEPSTASIESNSYTPLSRPLFIYVSLAAAERPEVAAFVDYYLDEANRVYIADTGYATYAQDIYDAVAERFANRVTGSAFLDFQPGDSVLDAVRDVR